MEGIKEEGGGRRSRALTINYSMKQTG